MKRLAKCVLIGALGVVLGHASGAAAQERQYRIGYIGDLSGPMVDSFAPVAEAFEFYVKDLNERGGINGIPVRLISRNDQLDPTRASSLAVELVTSENVNSIWGLSVSRTHMAVYQQAQRHKVPAIAMFSGVKEVLAPDALPYAYSLGHLFETAGEVSGKLAAEKVKRGSRIACSSIDAPGGVAVCEFTEGAAQAAGIDGATVLFPPTTAEFGPIAQKLVDAKPALMILHVPAGQNAGLVRALRNVGYNEPIMMGAHGLNEAPFIQAVKQTGYLSQLSILSRFASPDSDDKEVAAIRSVAQRYGKKDPISTTSIMGWVMGKVMEQALRACSYPCPGDKLNGVLESQTFDAGALMGGPIKFGPKDHYGRTWWRLYRYDQATNKFVADSGWVDAAPIPTLRKKR